MFNFLLRVILFLMGLVLAASIAVVILLFAAVWALRYGWGRLTGKPVTPWVMRFNPGSGFSRFRAAQQQRPVEPTAADTINARARGESVRSTTPLMGADEVTDVRSRPVADRD